MGFYKLWKYKILATQSLFYRGQKTGVGSSIGQVEKFAALKDTTCPILVKLSYSDTKEEFHNQTSTPQPAKQDKKIGVG